MRQPIVKRVLFTAIALATSLPALAAGESQPEETAPFTGDIPIMHEEALAAGIDHEYTGGWEFFVGGGAASFDCNGDRMPDLAIAGGSSPASLYVNKSPVGGALKFEKKGFGLPERDLKSVLGFYPVDIDNDRQMDLVVLRLGENLILKGGKDCTFEKANRLFSFSGGREWTTGFAATWEPGKTFPTLAIGNYVDRSAPGTPFGTCSDNYVFRSQENENPDYSEPYTLRPSYCSLSMLFTDWNRSGQMSLRVTNDRQYYRGGEEQMWQLPDGRPPRQYTASEGWRRLKIWGMGIAEADLNVDGYPEYALTSMGDTMLQTLDDEAEEQRPVYRDMAFEKKSTANRPYIGGDKRPSTGWHSQFADFNNDTNLDLFIAKGNVEVMPDFAAYDPDNLLLGGFDGKFHESGDKAGIALETKGRGGIVEDFNADGMLDLLVVNRKHNVNLFRNLGAKTGWGHRPLGNWLAIELDNGKLNPNAIGAKINVRSGTLTQTRMVHVGGGHASGQTGFIHLGLGVSERAVIRVQWPDGEWSPPYRVFTNEHVVIRRGADAAQYWFPVSD